MIVTFVEAARDELTEVRDWYASQQPEVAERFLAAVQDSLNQIGQYPFLARKTRVGAYRALLQDFPYAIIYQVFPEELRILAIAHQRRRPLYWRQRQS